MVVMLRRCVLLITTTYRKQGMFQPQLTSIQITLLLPPPRQFNFTQFPHVQLNKRKQRSRRRHHHHNQHNNRQFNIKLISVYLRASLTEQRPIINQHKYTKLEERKKTAQNTIHKTCDPSLTNHLLQLPITGKSNYVASKVAAMYRSDNCNGGQ